MRTLACLCVLLVPARVVWAGEVLVTGEAVPYILRVESDYAETRDAAWEDALAKAHARLTVHYHDLGLDERLVPQKEFIRRDMVQSSFFTEPIEFGPPLNTRMLKLSLEVEVAPEDIRRARSIERLIPTLRIVSLAIVFVGLLALFFRLDERTRGYFTTRLAIGGLLLFGGIAGLLFGMS